MTRESFLNRLCGQVLIGDGAIGTQLYEQGVGWESNYDQLNLTRPDLVLQLQQEYVDSGAQVIETNTFGANRHRLEKHGLGDQVQEICAAGARISIQASNPDVYVLGSIGPITALSGKQNKPELRDSELSDLFSEPVLALANAGVDAILLETFVHLPDLLIALQTAKKLTDLPVIAQLAFQERGHTFSGISADTAITSLKDAQAEIIGANCGRGVRSVFTAMETMVTQTNKPLSAYANAGLPEFHDGRYLYLTTPQYLADSAARLAELGVNLIGGCCGTTPLHIRAISDRLANCQLSVRVPKSVPDPSLNSGLSPVVSTELPIKQPDSFAHQKHTRPVILVELDPPRGLKHQYLIRRARQLADMGIDAITTGDNPVSVMRMGNLAFGQMIQQASGLPCVAHLSCRDRNLLGIQSYLLAAHAMNIHHVLAITGDPSRVGDQPGASSVYDLNSFGLIELITQFNCGYNHAGMDLGHPTQFTIGVALNQGSRNLKTRIDRLERKCQIGAHFSMTQPVFDPEMIVRIRKLTEPLSIPIYFGLFPLLSERNAEYLHHEVPGVELTPDVLKQMKGTSGKIGRKTGLKICREIIEATIDIVDGFYIIPPQARTDTASSLAGFIRDLSPSPPPT